MGEGRAARCASSGVVTVARARRTVLQQPAAAAAVVRPHSPGAAATATARNGFAVAAIFPFRIVPGAAAATAARDNERDITGRDHEAAPASCADKVEAAAVAFAAYRDAQNLASGELDVAADVSPQPTVARSTRTAARANGFDVVHPGQGHCVGNDLAGITEGGCRCGRGGAAGNIGA
jgi:hypothetical protein